MIAILLAITARALIWLVGDNEMAGHALIIRLCLMAAVIVIFPLVYCWKFVTAPAKVAAEANETITQYEQRCAILEIGNPYSVSNSSFGGIRWMIKIHNTGASADNVHMNLCDISPRPRSQFSDAAYPYRIVQAGRTLDSNECHIHQGGDAIFELTQIERAAYDSGFLTTLNTRIHGSNRVKIEPWERWEKMEYAVTAGNSDLLKFTLRMHTNANGVVFEKVA